MKKRFEPLEGRNAEIIESVLTCDEMQGLSDGQLFNIRLCVEEVEENILQYSGSTWIDLWVERADGVITIGFKDGGIEFDPLAKPDPDITASIDERPIGGLGIFLCKKLMTSVEYRFEQKCNIFLMRMKL